MSQHKAGNLLLGQHLLTGGGNRLSGSRGDGRNCIYSSELGRICFSSVTKSPAMS